jgi:hypothetical protein
MRMINAQFEWQYSIKFLQIGIYHKSILSSVKTYWIMISPAKFATGDLYYVLEVNNYIFAA